MKKGIKTRDVVKGTIKTIDKASIAGQRMKSAYISTKNSAENSYSSSENSIEEYASSKLEQGIGKVAYGTKTASQKSISYTRRGITNLRNRNTLKKQFKKTSQSTTKTIKAAKHTSKTAIKTAHNTTKTTKATVQASAKSVKSLAQSARVAAKTTVAAAKATIKAVIATTKAIIAGVKALVGAIAAGGWVAVLIILIVCLVGLLISSVFGIFFSGEDSGNGLTMQTVVSEINTEYDNKLTSIRNNNSHDVLEMGGSRAVWKEVLAVYAVKTNLDKDNPQEVATMTISKKQLLTDIFWQMNSISHRTESKTETIIKETDDENGNIVQTESTVTRTYLYITVTHKSTDEMAEQYGFSSEQKKYLNELLKDENNSLWAAVLYGINASDEQIVSVALGEVGNVGGEKYWRWYGFNSKVEWCACFVSWCSNQCGYIDAGIIPKFALCSDGVDWFKTRNQWIDRNSTPSAGMIAFFDWNNENGQDGSADHVGIVQKVEDGKIYIIEGNTSDSCKVREYPLDYYEILGYGIPKY